MTSLLDLTSMAGAGGFTPKPYQHGGRGILVELAAGWGTALHGISGESRLCGRDRFPCTHGRPAGKARLLGWSGGGANSVFGVEKGLAGSANRRHHGRSAWRARGPAGDGYRHVDCIPRRLFPGRSGVHGLGPASGSPFPWRAGQEGPLPGPGAERTPLSLCFAPWWWLLWSRFHRSFKPPVAAMSPLLDSSCIHLIPPVLQQIWSGLP